MSRRSALIVVLGRSLATQLDRLRHTLDSLGQRLRDAVAQAVGETVGTAVRQTLHIALADDLAHAVAFDRPCAPRYRDPPAWDEPEEQSWNQSSGDPYSGWPDAEGAGSVTYSECEPVPETEGFRGAAVRLLWVGCQAMAWLMRRHSARHPLLAALGVGAACGIAAYLGGPLVSAGVGVAGSALGLATLAETVRSSARARTGRDTLD